MSTSQPLTTVTANAVATLRQELNKSFPERAELIDGILTALLSKQALFVLGPPGTAKSTIVRNICRKALGAKYFERLITKVSTPDELFGSISIEGLKNNKYERVTQNMLPEADVAFLDEVFKGSSAILNTLLTITDESRTFYNGGAPITAPLQTVIGASNEVPQAEELGALWDRFVLRYTVDRIQNDDAMAELFRGGLQVNLSTLTLEQLAVEQKAAQAVRVPEETIKLLIELRKAVHQAGHYISDRRWMQSVTILKAYAHLNGRTEAQADDFEILENVLWNDPAQRKEIRRLISKIANPVGEVIMKVMDGVNEVFENLKNGKIQPTDAVNKIKTAKKQLEKAGSPDSNVKLKEAIDQCVKIHKVIVQEYLGLDL